MRTTVVALDQPVQESKQLEDITRAIDDIRKARTLLADSPLVLAVSLSILTDGIELAEHQGRVDEKKAWCALAEEVVAALQTYRSCSVGKHEVSRPRLGKDNGTWTCAIPAEPR